MRARHSLLWSLSCACLALAAPARAQVALPAYNVAPSTVTISGISSGGFMAVQMHVAYSSHIHGAAIFAGGPFYCEQDDTTDCNSGSGMVLSDYLDYTAAQEDAGTIDPTSNLAGQPIYMFSGTNDSIIYPVVMAMLYQYYQAYDAASNITFNNNTPAEHAWISPDGPNSCGTLWPPYINNCSIDPEQTFLTMFYGALNPKNTGTLGGSFIQFNQGPFCAGGSCSAISMDNTGWLYVPASCAAGQACKLVMVLHGCLTGQDVVGQDVVKEAGVNEWADTNDIVVIYPQAIIAARATPRAAGTWWATPGPTTRCRAARRCRP
jgi:poly(3-hydroxybutyrate) depolymerase